MTEPTENERDARTTNEGAARRPYVRPARQHRTVGAVDDLAADDAESDYSHDSEFTVGSRSPLPGRAYRRSRNEMPQLKHDLQYGQYLSVPRDARTSSCTTGAVAACARSSPSSWSWRFWPSRPPRPGSSRATRPH